MPLYDYDCSACGHRFEVLVRGSEPTECPNCHATTIARAISAFGVSSDATRKSNLESARRANRKIQRDKAIADHEDAHHHHH